MNLRLDEIEQPETKPSWISLEFLFNVIKDKMSLIHQKSNSWHWSKNTRCKYIQIYLDTRDGLCTIKDRYGKYITLDELIFQGINNEPKNRPN